MLFQQFAWAAIAWGNWTAIVLVAVYHPRLFEGRWLLDCVLTAVVIAWLAAFQKVNCLADGQQFGNSKRVGVEESAGILEAERFAVPAGGMTMARLQPPDQCVIQVDRPGEKLDMPSIRAVLEGTGVELDPSYGPILINPKFGRYVVRGILSPEARVKIGQIPGVRLFADPRQKLISQ